MDCSEAHILQIPHRKDSSKEYPSLTSSLLFCFGISRLTSRLTKSFHRLTYHSSFSTKKALNFSNLFSSNFTKLVTSLETSPASLTLHTKSLSSANMGCLVEICLRLWDRSASAASSSPYRLQNHLIRFFLVDDLVKFELGVHIMLLRVANVLLD